MNHSRVLLGTGYGIALLLVFLPLLEPVVTLLPLQPTQVAWRLQAFGVFSQALLLPLAGGAVGVGTAVLLGHRRVIRALAVVSFVAAATLAGAAILFGLDLLQYRGAVGPGLVKHYQVAGGIYLLAFLLAASFLAWVGLASWRVARIPRRRRRSRRVQVDEAVSVTSRPGG